MKITHICLMGPVTDGWNYQENLMTKYQVIQGNQVTIITSRWVWGNNGKLALVDANDYINTDNVRVIRLNMKGKENFSNRFKNYQNLYRTIEATNPDILFIHDVANMTNGILVKYLRKHINVIAYADNHADLTNSGTNWLSKNILHKIIWRFQAQRLQPYVKKFYGVLPVRVDFLKEMYRLPAEKCKLLVMGADDILVEAAAKKEVIQRLREQYNISEDDFLIVTGGKIDAYKFQTLLLMEAVKEINNPKVKLIVFGSIEEQLREKADSLADGVKVQNIGWIKAEDTYQYFASADLVVFPGRHSVFWEQVAAQGIPMLCKYLEGTQHIDIGGNVRFLKTDSIEEIRQEIEWLMDHPDEYQRMKNVAVENGMKEFSYANIAKRAIEE